MSAFAASAPAFHFVFLNTKAPISIVQAVSVGRDRGFSAFAVDHTRLSFRNMDSRTANHVRFGFVYYDKTGKQVGGDVSDRRGTFSTGALIEGFSLRSLTPNDENCVLTHFPPDGIALFNNEAKA